MSLSLVYSDPERTRSAVPRSQPAGCAPGLRLVGTPSDRLLQLADMLAVAGEGAVASHAAAAHLWGFPELLPWRAEVASARCDRYRLRKVRAHRSLDLSAEDVTKQLGFPVTTVARMLIDLSSRCSLWRLLEVFDRAEARGLVTVAELRASCERLRQAPGRRRSVIRALLELRQGAGPRDSALALRTAAAVADSGLPSVSAGTPIRVGTWVARLPLAYPGSRIAVLCASWGHEPSAAEEAVRATLRTARWHVVTVTWAMSDAEIVSAIGDALMGNRRGR